MGGLAGHMMHPHDAMNLKLGQLKTIVANSIYGKYQMVEKMDGFNIHILKHNGQIRFARNGQDLLDGGFTDADMDNRFTSERVRAIYKVAYDMAKTINPDWLEEFSERGATYNCEVVTDRANIMPYTCGMKIIFHNVFMWRWDNGAYVQTGTGIITQPELLKMSAPTIYLDRNIDFVSVDSLLNRLEEIFKKYELTDEHTLKDYYRIRFIQYMLENQKDILNGCESTENVHKLIAALFNRFFNDGEQMNLKAIRKLTTANITPLIKIQSAITYAVKIEMDEYILQVGTIILRYAHNYTNEKYAIDSIPILTEEIRAQFSLDEADDKQVRRWRSCNYNIFALEGVVFEAEGYTFKWTGPFAPLNQMIGRQR